MPDGADDMATESEVRILKTGKAAPRSLSVIAREIMSLWLAPYFGAVPYIEAMAQLETCEEAFGYDSGKSIVLYFLSNARGWRGPDAKRIKDELRAAAGVKS